MVERISGKNRIETAIEASKLAYDRANTVILAGSKGEVDALTGTLLASHEDGPLLLTNRDLLAKDVKDELKRLKAKKIIILGGYSVVSEKVQEELEKDYKIERIAGSNREKTANKVAKRVKGEAAKRKIVLSFFEESPNPDFQAEDHEAIKAIMKSEFEE